MRTLELIILILSVIVANSLNASADRSRTSQWLTYEPNEVELHGVLVIKDKFGPPGWGESPADDIALRVPILVLSVPINVRGDSNSDANADSVEGATEVQLNGDKEWERFNGKPVSVKGALSHAQTAWDFADIILRVRVITSVENTAK